MTDTDKSAPDDDPHGSGPEVGPEPRSVGSHVWGWTKELLIVIVLGLVVSTLLRTFVFQMFEIPSGSMEDTLQVGDRVAVQKVTPFQRGDIVVFADPGGWLPQTLPEERNPLERALEFVGILPNTSDQYLIKRVIGMPGDVIICCDTQNRLLVNGYPLEESGYLFQYNGASVKPSEVQFQVTVPAGRIFVMGDHRNASADSRCHLNDLAADGIRGSNAFVPTDRVVGVAVAITWPVNRVRTLPRPATFAGVPPPAEPAPVQAKIEPAGVTCYG